MRRWLLLAVLGATALANTGCLLNAYSGDPNERMSQLMVQSEDLRQIRAEWDHFWFTDQPSHMTPVPIHGGITPSF